MRKIEIHIKSLVEKVEIKGCPYSQCSHLKECLGKQCLQMSDQVSKALSHVIENAEKFALTVDPDHNTHKKEFC